MAVLGPVWVPLLLVLLVALVVTTTDRRPVTPGSGTGDGSGTAGAVARGTARWRAGGLAVGLVAAGLVLTRSHLGVGELLAAPAAALGVFAGVVVGELRGPRPTGPVRSAPMEVRRVRDHVPPGLTRGVSLALAGLALLLVTTTIMGSADDLGRPGRSLVHRRDGLVVEARGPWPGSYYSVPLALLVAVGLAVGVLALLRVVRRPRPEGDRTADDVVRRRSAEAVVAAAGLLAGVPLAGSAGVAAAALLGTTDRPLAWSVLGWLLVTVVPPALVVAARCAVLLVAPPAVSRPAPPADRR